MRVLSVGSLPPSWGGPIYGGVATLHATLLEGFLLDDVPVEVAGIVPPAPPTRPLPVPVHERDPELPTAHFYARLLERVQPDAVLMHHFAHTIGVTHARLDAPPPAVAVAHSWHHITFRTSADRDRARAITEEALAGLAALAFMSRHCHDEGLELGLRYPSAVETIYHPLQPSYLGADVDVGAHERRGVACLGSLIPRKRPQALADAAARVDGLEVTFVGHGELEPELRESIDRRGLVERVRIRQLDDAAVRDLLLRSEAMCLPSSSETFGLAYSEALACGTPVVGFAPTLREIAAEMGVDVGEPIDGDDGPAAIAAAIERVRARDWDRAELRRRAVEAFDLRRAADRYANLLARVARRAATSSA